MNRQIRERWADLHQELKNFIFRKVNIDTSEDIIQAVFFKIRLNIDTPSDCSKHELCIANEAGRIVLG